VLLPSLSGIPQMSRIIPEEAGFLRDKIALLAEKM
jgi:hypothetical protein